MAVATDAIKATWPPPNYNNPVNLDGLVIGCTVPVLALSIICKLYSYECLCHAKPQTTAKLIFSLGYTLLW